MLTVYFRDISKRNVPICRGLVAAVHCLFVIILRYMEDGKAMGRHIRKVLCFDFPDKNMVTGQCDRKVTLELKNILEDSWI